MLHIPNIPGVYKNNKYILHRRCMPSIMVVSCLLVYCLLSCLVVFAIPFSYNENSDGRENDALLLMIKGNTSAAHIVLVAYN